MSEDPDITSVTPVSSPESVGAALGRVAARIELQDLRTIGMVARLQADPPDISRPLAARLTVGLRTRRDDQGLRLTGQFILKAHANDQSESEAFLHLRLQLVAYYRLDEGFIPTEAELEAFAKTSGMINLWPYFRAFVQQTCGQLSIPPIVLPPFRVGQALNVRFQHDEPSGSSAGSAVGERPPDLSAPR